MTNSNYSEHSISKLTEKEKILKNLWMYIWRTDEYGVIQQVKEVLSNSIDEYLSGYCTNIELSVNTDTNVLSISDNWRWIPIWYNENGISTIEEIFTTIHMWGKFDNGDATKSYEFSGWMHWVWSCLITYVSDFVNIVVKRDWYIYKLRFENWDLVEKTHIIWETSETWTFIEWLPSKTYLDFNKVSFEKISSLVKRQHYLTKNLTYKVIQLNQNNEVVTSDLYENTQGLGQYISYTLEWDQNLRGLSQLYEQEEKVFTVTNSKTGKEERCKVQFAFQYVNQNKTSVIWYTNNIHQPEWGTHVQGLLDLIHTTVKESLDASQIKIPKDVIKDDFINWVIGVISVNIPRPTLEGQTKNKLGDTFVTKMITNEFKEDLKLKLLSDVKELERIAKHIQTNVETRRSIENIQKATLKKVKDPVLDSDSKLVDAEWKDRSKCELFIVEGDSAWWGIEEMRDSQTQWVYKLKGKPLNAIVTDTQRIFDNKELKNLIYALWCGIGKNFDATKLRYNKIFILCDSDSDWKHIITLLLWFLKKVIPQLFKQKVIFSVLPPLYGVTDNKWKKYYLRDKKRLQEFLEKKWEKEKVIITRFKWLGEMEPEELYETCINPKNRITELVTDIESEENSEFITWVLWNESQFKYDFLKNYDDYEELEIKKSSSSELREVAAKWMYEFGMYVNEDRAISSLEDWLKPVHRRLLWAMLKMGVWSSWKTTKSARVVWETIGKYHPHGDSAAYGAAVKLTQQFYTENPLIIKQGNFWSVFWMNNYASSRYTEMKLAKFTEDILLDNLSERSQIVDFKDNYDGTLLEPSYLPSKIPMSLLLPSFWMWLGMSSDIPPHNLSEVVNWLIWYIENHDCNLLDFIKWPDFPINDNEIISSNEEIEKVYNEWWSIRYRVKLHYDEKKNQISIKSLPYNIEFDTIYKKLLELVRWERRVLKNKKEVTEVIPFNKSLRKEIKKVNNYSWLAWNKNWSVINIVLDLHKDVNIEIVKAKLYKLTSLETSVSFRPILINRKKKIKKYTLKWIFADFLSFRQETLQRYFKNVLIGLNQQKFNISTKLLALSKLKEVIDIITSSKTDDVLKESLKTLLFITDEQVDLILSMTLRSLRNLEKTELEKKLFDLEEEIIKYTKLQDEKEMNKYIVKELKWILKQYWTERRTEVIWKQKTVNLESNIEAIYEDKEVTLFIDKSTKVVFKVSGRDIKIDNRRNTFIEKYGDNFYEITCNNRDKLYLVQKWKWYILQVWDIKDESYHPISLYNSKVTSHDHIEVLWSTSDLEKHLIVSYKDWNLSRVKVWDITKSTQWFSVTSKEIDKFWTYNEEKEITGIFRKTEEWFFLYSVIDDIPVRTSLWVGVKTRSKTIELLFVKTHILDYNNQKYNLSTIDQISRDKKWQKIDLLQNYLLEETIVEESNLEDEIEINISENEEE